MVTFLNLQRDGRRVGVYEQRANEFSPSEAQISGATAAPASNADATSHRCFRVMHSSGDTLCSDLASARLLQQQKPGAKIFLVHDD